MTEGLGKLLRLPVAVDREDLPMDRVELSGVRWRYPRSSHVRLSVEFMNDSFIRYMVWVSVLADHVRDIHGDRRIQRAHLDSTFPTPPALLHGIRALYELQFTVEGCKSSRVAYADVMRAYLRKCGTVKITDGDVSTELIFVLHLPEGISFEVQSMETFSDWIVPK